MSHNTSQDLTDFSRTSRRNFGTRLLAAGSLPCLMGLADAWIPNVSAIEPIVRPVPGRLHLSLAAYSLRDLLTKKDSGWDLFRFVDYCHEHGVPGAELTSYYFPSDVDTAYLLRMKRYCHERGITISGGAIGNDFCQPDEAKLQSDIDKAKMWIDHYSILGAPVIRIFAGKQPEGEEWPITRDRCVRTIETVAKYASERGVMLGLENHGGVTALATGLLDIVKRVQSDAFGINLDSGNFRSTEDPYEELRQIAPYALNAQLKVEVYPSGKREWTDIPRVLRILKESGYSGWVALEYEASEPPLESIPGWLEKMKTGLRELGD